MQEAWGESLLKQLKQPNLTFGEKLCVVEKLLPVADELLGIRLAKVLIESALEIKPTKKELYYLCEASEGSAMLGDYLRGLFNDSEISPKMMEMAERLEQVLTFRIINPHPHQYQRNDVKLHQSVHDYLLRAHAA